MNLTDLFENSRDKPHHPVGTKKQEPGIPGNVPAEKIPGKQDLLKGRGRTYYEDQKTPGDDWYDDEEDQETDLRSGDYVRDQQDGESGEVFRMQGDPYERRVRILDRDGRGWYIEPGRLTRVDPTDPDVQRYFGKKRVHDMDEQGVAEAGRYGSRNPDTMSAGDYDRYQQDQMDFDRRDFKRREHEAEWEQEKAYSEKLAARDAGTWYIRINGKILKDKQGQPYTFSGKAAANRAAVTMMAKPFNTGKEFLLTTSAADKI